MELPDDNGVIWCAGIDYLTMTYSPEFHSQYARAVDCCDILFEEQKRNGHKIKAGRVRDYHGQQSASLFCGGREDSYIIQASSETADALAKLCCLNGCDGKATRVDFQVTVQYREDFRRRATAIRQQLRAWETAASRSQEMGLSLMEGHRTGDSIAIGSRTSARYRRVYDKTREQRGKVADRLWRWEVEYKEKVAIEGMRALMRTNDTATLSRAVVIAEFSKVGLSQAWMRGICGQQLRATWNPTDNDRRLRWLQNHVKGSIEHLRAAGQIDEALDALGLFSETRNEG